MRKKKYEWTEAKYRKYIAGGRGTGSGMEYKPWIYVHGIPSAGNVNEEGSQG